MTKSSRAIFAGASRPTGRRAGMGRRTGAIMAVMAVSLLAGSVAFADPPGDHDHDRDHHEWRHDEHDRGEHRGEWRHHDEDRYEDRRHERFEEGEYRRPHGYYVHHWRRGERLPIEYRAPVYVVPDAAIYHLRPPPPGYYWVRVDNNAVLAAVATGVVVDVAVNLFH